MSYWLQRSEMLFGNEALEKLKSCHVAIFGVGGVGGFTLEALIRGGIGKIDIIDNDIFDETNLNRQLLSTCETIGKSKVEVARDRALNINPTLKITIHNTFVLPENIDTFDFTNFDYVVDAIDTIAGKIAIIKAANAANVPIISSMGTGNKISPEKLTITTIEKTTGDPLARIMRKKLKALGIQGVTVVYSPELPFGKEYREENNIIPGSCSFVPSAAGIMIASVVLRELMGIR